MDNDIQEEGNRKIQRIMSKIDQLDHALLIRLLGRLLPLVDKHRHAIERTR